MDQDASHMDGELDLRLFVWFHGPIESREAFERLQVSKHFVVVVVVVVIIIIIVVVFVVVFVVSCCF